MSIYFIRFGQIKEFEIEIPLWTGIFEWFETFFKKNEKRGWRDRLYVIIYQCWRAEGGAETAKVFGNWTVGACEKSRA